MRFVGSPLERVIEESRATIDAQMKALVAGTIAVVMLPMGSSYVPPLPAGFAETVAMTGPGAGTFIYDPEVWHSTDIQDLARSGQHGSLLGHIQSKVDVGINAFVLCAISPDGVLIQDSAVSADRDDLIGMQRQVLEVRHPGAKIIMRRPTEVMQLRAREARLEKEAGL